MDEVDVPRPKRRDRWMYLLMGVLAVGLLMTRPMADPSLTGSEAGTAGCLDNLRQLGVAYAQYARDYDGKIPRGVDPEDRYNSTIWAQSMEYGGRYLDDSQQTPFLHEILRPYVKSGEVFHCPDDDGWKRSRLSMLTESRLTNVKPSSFGKYGTSYYCLTKFGFTESSAADLESPSTSLLLFDGDLWHGNPRNSLNGLFADGHVANISTGEFELYAK